MICEVTNWKRGREERGERERERERERESSTLLANHKERITTSMHKDLTINTYKTIPTRLFGSHVTRPLPAQNLYPPTHGHLPPTCSSFVENAFS